jgi:hypothetical protein
VLARHSRLTAQDRRPGTAAGETAGRRESPGPAESLQPEDFRGR